MKNKNDPQHRHYGHRHCHHGSCAEPQPSRTPAPYRAADAPASLTDGSYGTASAQGCLSEVGVTVTVTGGKVTNVAGRRLGEAQNWAAKLPRAWLLHCSRPVLPAGGTPSPVPL